MRPRLATLAATCGAQLLVCAGLQAQNPVTRTMQTVEERAAHNLTEAAEDMPEELYGFRPTPAQMTFGEVVLHVAAGNTFLCSAIAGKAPPEQPKSPAYSKDKLVERLEKSFDLCNSALEHADDSRLSDSIPFFGGRKATLAAALVELAGDWGDHYSQLAIYLRLNGVLPPTAKRKER
jgi:DinB family protein